MPTYILTPSTTTPPNTNLNLGNILSDPKVPTRALNRYTPVPIPAHEITTFTERDYSATIDDVRAHRFGIWTTFLASILGLGGDISSDNKNSNTAVYTCSTLETVSFEPDTEFIGRSLRAPVVEAYRRRTLGQRPVYMITGIKIARGANVATNRERSIAGGVKIGVDGTQAGVPLGGGPEISIERTKKVGVSVGACDDFVLAYRLIKIKEKRSGRIVGEDFNKWALLDDGDVNDMASTLCVGQEAWFTEGIDEHELDLIGCTLYETTD